MTDQKPETPRCRACGHIAHEQNECRVCAGCDDGRPMPGKADAPAIFLCQVCDQTPERGHAPDCPGATQPPVVALALGVITTDMMQKVEREAAPPAETPPLLTMTEQEWTNVTASILDIPHLSPGAYVRKLAAEVRAQAAALRTAEQERDDLRQRDEYRRSNAGTCAICGTTIWGRDGLIQDERVMHPLCQLRQRAEHAEREAAALRKEIDTHKAAVRVLVNERNEAWADLAALRQRGQALEKIEALCTPYADPVTGMFTFRHAGTLAEDVLRIVRQLAPPAGETPAQEKP